MAYWTQDHLVIFYLFTWSSDFLLNRSSGFGLMYQLVFWMASKNQIKSIEMIKSGYVKSYRGKMSMFCLLHRDLTMIIIVIMVLVSRCFSINAFFFFQKFYIIIKNNSLVLFFKKIFDIFGYCTDELFLSFKKF